MGKMSTMYSLSMDARIDKKQEYRDNTDRIEAERFFSRNKRCYGMGCIVVKPEETQLTFIALSVFVLNLFKIQKRILWAFIRLYHKYMVRGRRYKLKVA